MKCVRDKVKQKHKGQLKDNGFTLNLTERMKELGFIIIKQKLSINFEQFNDLSFIFMQVFFTPLLNLIFISVYLYYTLSGSYGKLTHVHGITEFFFHPFLLSLHL